MGKPKPVKQTYPMLVINTHSEREFQVYVKTFTLEEAYEWVVRKFPPPLYKHYAQTVKK